MKYFFYGYLALIVLLAGAKVGFAVAWSSARMKAIPVAQAKSARVRVPREASPSTEADTLDTELYAGETAVTSTVLTASSSLLVRPPLEYLWQVKGDPLLKSGEHGVRVPVFMYHHIRDFLPKDTPRQKQFIVTPASLDAQIAELVARGYEGITPDELLLAITSSTYTLPPKPVLLTFDDGFRDQYTNAFPILRRYGMRATYFVLTDVPGKEAYMTNEMIYDLAHSSLITIASHTRHHAFLTRIFLTQRQEEIVLAKTELEKMIGGMVTAFAYPYGDKNPSVERDVAATYAIGFSARLGSLHTSSTRYELRRIRVLDRENVGDLADVFSKR
jgi:peptidoglycan/xylan/chitin deacetylase (PgdA/CDA1 family)